MYFSSLLLALVQPHWLTGHKTPVYLLTYSSLLQVCLIVLNQPLNERGHIQSLTSALTHDLPHIYTIPLTEKITTHL